MRRSRIHTAVLLAMATGAAPLSAEVRQADIDEVTHRMDMMPELYGQISLVYEHNHTNDGVTGGESRFKDNESFIGARNQHEIMPGLDGFFRAEWWFNANRESENDTFEKLEYGYIGVEGDFGRIWAGTDDTVYRQQLDQIVDFFESEFRHGPGGVEQQRNIRGPYDTGRSRLLQYSSPVTNGWQLHGAVQLNEDGEDEVIEGDGEGDSSRPFQLVSTYQSGNWEWALGMDSNDGASGPDNENTYAGRGTYEREQWSMTAQYQRREGIGNVFGFLSTYSIGPNQFAFAYERGRDKDDRMVDANDDQTGFWLRDGERVHTYTVQVMHELSERMRLYVEGHQAESDENAHRRDLMIGAAYRF